MVWGALALCDAVYGFIMSTFCSLLRIVALLCEGMWDVEVLHIQLLATWGLAINEEDYTMQAPHMPLATRIICISHVSQI